MAERLNYQCKFEKYKEELIRLRRHFHRHPELGLQEFETSAFIQEYLGKLGYRFRIVEPTGIIAEHPCQDEAAFAGKKKVVLRAEMDALPIQEQTGLSYASENAGVMHACGHDGIVASALVLARILAEEGEVFPVRMRFLFEPAEEIGEGAKRMLAAGALDGEPDIFLMFHYAVDQSFGMAVHEGQASAMINGMEIRVHGKSSHWCEAQKGIDSIYGAAQVINAIHDLNENYGREHPDAGKYILGIGTVQGGKYTNIIADHVVMNGNIRAAYEETYHALKKELEEKLVEIGQQTGTQITMDFPKEPVYPFANDDGLVDIACQVGNKIFGDRFILEGEDELFLSGDNAYRYFRETKGLFAIFLAGIPGKSHPLHHNQFQIDEAVLPCSVEALYEIVKGI